MTINDDGWYFSKYVSGNGHLFTFKQEQSQYKNCNIKTCTLYTEVPKVKCLFNLCIVNVKFHIIPIAQSWVIKKVHNLLGQSSYPRIYRKHLRCISYLTYYMNNWFVLLTAFIMTHLNYRKIKDQKSSTYSLERLSPHLTTIKRNNQRTNGPLTLI